MILVFSRPSDSGSKVQMVAHCSTVRVTVRVTLLVNLCFWRSLGTPGVFSATLRVAQASSHRNCILGACSAEVAALACSDRGPNSGLVPLWFQICAPDWQMSLVPAYFL